MSTIRLKSGTVFGHGSIAVALLVAACVSVPAYAQVASDGVHATVGRIEFDFADAPVAAVEIDLKEGMLSAFTGIGKAAVQGAAQALLDSRPGPDSDAVQQSADHLASVSDILDITSRVIREVRVRVYKNLAEQTRDTYASMVEHYQNKLDGTNWENVVRVRDTDDSVIVCVLQHDSAIRGLFIMVSDRDDLVLVNVVCQLTPENVKQLTNQATKIGMKAGLEGVIEDAMRSINRQ